MRMVARVSLLDLHLNMHVQQIVLVIPSIKTLLKGRAVQYLKQWVYSGGFPVGPATQSLNLGVLLRECNFYQCLRHGIYNACSVVCVFVEASIGRSDLFIVVVCFAG